MEDIQPDFVPPIVPIPQVSPQQVTTNRKVYIAPALKAVSMPQQVPQTPLPQLSPNNRYMCLVPAITLLSLAQQLPQTPMPPPVDDSQQYYIPPAMGMPTTLPQTPMPQAITGTRMGYTPAIGVAKGAPMNPAQPWLPSKPPCSIPGYLPYKMKGNEPGIGETLMSCATLLVMALLVLTVLYFLVR